jgi:hypothetical protein
MLGSAARIMLLISFDESGLKRKTTTYDMSSAKTWIKNFKPKYKTFYLDTKLPTQV